MALRFGKYLVESEIGRGGFGRVYRAVDADMMRPVAIKVLASESDSDLLSRFQAEAGTTANLAHKNIVIVYEFGQQDGTPYLVMELLEGKTLTEVITGPALSLLEKVEVMFQVAEGLEHAHSRGVIHRDIKPGNIMLLPDGTVKIMDFGIARVMGRDAIRRTREGDLIGTVSYMAPEMFHNHEPDKKTDIFAYGVLYYELLCGENPFRSDDPYTAMRRILNDDPYPLTARLPECPEGLEILVQHLLMKDRETRFDDFQGILFDTEPVLRQMRQDRAAALTQEIEPLLTQGNFEGAYAKVRAILELDPAQREARAWRDQIRRRFNQQRAERLRTQGAEYMAGLRYKEAVTCFESALHMDANQPDVLALLNEAKAGIDRIKRAAELISDARTERERGRLEAAYAKVSEAIRIDPINQEAISLRDSLRRQLRAVKMAACLTRSEDLCRQGLYKDALQVLDGIDADLQNHLDVIRLRAQINSEQREAERRQREADFQKELKATNETIATVSLETAAELGEALYRKHPDQPAAFELRSLVRERLEREKKKQAVAKVTQLARELIGQKRFEEARSLVGDALKSNPGDPSLLEVVKTIDVLVTAQERLLAIERVLQRADELSDEGHLERALDLVDKAVARLGEDNVLLNCQQNLRHKRVEQVYAQRLQKILAEAQSTADAGQHRKAAQILENSASEFRGDSRFETALHDCREKAQKQEERELIAQVLREIRSLEAEERHIEALQEVNSVIARCGEKQELQAAADRLRAAIAQQERDRVLRDNIHQIRAAIAIEDWPLASDRLAMARDYFPDNLTVEELAGSIIAGQRRSELRIIEARIREAVDREDFQVAENQLTKTEKAFGQESVWISLRDLLLERKRYRSVLTSAEQACADQNYVSAKALLEEVRKAAPDARAKRLYNIACKQIQRMEAEEYARRTAEEQFEERRRSTVERAKSLAREFAAQGDLLQARAELQRAIRQYPDLERERAELDAELVRIAEAEQGRRREREELRRRERDAAMSVCRSEMARATQIEDYGAALARLSRFEVEWGETSSTRAEKERLLRASEVKQNEERERARIEAEERLLAAREQDLAQIRSAVSSALKAGEYRRALDRLKQASKKYPEISEFRQQQLSITEQTKSAKAQQAAQERLKAAELAKNKREITIAEQREKAAALARAGDLAGAVSVLERLSKQYPNSSDVRRELQAATRELLYQRELMDRSEADSGELTKNRLQYYEKVGRETFELFKQGRFSDAFKALKDSMGPSRK